MGNYVNDKTRGGSGEIMLVLACHWQSTGWRLMLCSSLIQQPERQHGTLTSPQIVGRAAS